MDKYERMDDLLQSLDESDIVTVWNEFCSSCSYMEDYIYPMYELDTFFQGCLFSDALNRIDTDDFNLNDDYFVDGIYGVKSVDYLDDIIIYTDLADWIVDNDEDCMVAEIRLLLDEFEDEDEDEDED